MGPGKQLDSVDLGSKSGFPCQIAPFTELAVFPAPLRV